MAALLWRGPEREPPALLYTDVAGWDVMITEVGGMQFRWPKRGQRF